MNRKFYGIEVSDYAQEHGYVDYATLISCFGAVCNSGIIRNVEANDWDLINGCEWDEDNNFKEVYDWYIIDEYGAQLLQKHTNELVYYNGKLEMYLWGVTHFGTAWTNVLTEIKLEEE